LGNGQVEKAEDSSERAPARVYSLICKLNKNTRSTWTCDCTLNTSIINAEVTPHKSDPSSKMHTEYEKTHLTENIVYAFQHEMKSTYGNLTTS